jgi:hypothetical protein
MTTMRLVEEFLGDDAFDLFVDEYDPLDSFLWSFSELESGNGMEDLGKLRRRSGWFEIDGDIGIE